MGHRRQARELALQALYLQDMCHFSLEEALKTVLKETTDESVKDFCSHLVCGVIERSEPIDQILKRYTQNWELQRMASVDRNLLRLATLEMLTDLETPPSVIIDEAIEMAKIFSTRDSGKFVNGILDKVQKERPQNAGS
jgi:N utilization substance protein B